MRKSARMRVGAGLSDTQAWKPFVESQTSASAIDVARAVAAMPDRSVDRKYNPLPIAFLGTLVQAVTAADRNESEMGDKKNLLNSLGSFVSYESSPAGALTSTSNLSWGRCRVALILRTVGLGPL